MNRQIKVRGIAVHGGKLLCVQLKPYNNLSAEGEPFWCLPGGTVEDNEPLLDAMHREMVEETSIEPKLDRVLYIQQFAHKGIDYLEFFFYINNAADYLHIDLSKTTHGVQEIEKIEFVDPTAVRVMPDFLATDDLAAVIASNDPPRFVTRY